jgi:hypothetical protein
MSAATERDFLSLGAAILEMRDPDNVSIDLIRFVPEELGKVIGSWTAPCGRTVLATSEGVMFICPLHPERL